MGVSLRQGAEGSAQLIRTLRSPSMGPTLRNKDGRAVATFRDSETGRRRDYTFGAFGTADAESKYLAFAARWAAMGKRLPGVRAEHARVEDLVLAYWLDVKERRSDAATIKIALRLLNRHFGRVPVDEFGPLRFRELREIMVRVGNGGSKPWSRSYVNKQAKTIRAAFRFGVGIEMVRAETASALECVAPLRRGETKAPENKPVEAAVLEHVLATLPHLNRQIRAAVELQLVTAARPSEILRIRPADITVKSDDLWIYDSPVSKTGRRRLIALGPVAIDALRPFMDRKPPRPCLSPREAELESRGRVRRHGKIRTGRFYTSGSYRNAITRACEAADVPAWTPYQLRHWAITEIEFNTDEQSAAIVAGHSTTRVTREVYIHRAARNLAPIIERCAFMRGAPA